jgi:uridine kinase
VFRDRPCTCGTISGLTVQRLIVIAGASGSGKSTAAHGSGLPVLGLDAFYRDRSAPGMPRWLGDVDWEHPDAFDARRAADAVTELVRTGRVTIRAHDVGTERTETDHTVTISGPCLVIEGVMAIAAVRLLDPALSCERVVFVLRRSILANLATRVRRDTVVRGRRLHRAVLRSIHVATQERRLVRDAVREGATVVDRRKLRVALDAERRRCVGQDDVLPR